MLFSHSKWNFINFEILKPLKPNFLYSKESKPSIINITKWKCNKNYNFVRQEIYLPKSLTVNTQYKVIYLNDIVKHHKITYLRKKTEHPNANRICSKYKEINKKRSSPLYLPCISLSCSNSMNAYPLGFPVTRFMIMCTWEQHRSHIWQIKHSQNNAKEIPHPIDSSTEVIFISVVGQF